MAKKRHRRHGRRRHRGVGTSITLRGLGRMKSPSAMMTFAVPTLVGGAVTLGAILAARYFTIPAAGQAFTPTTQSVYKNAPWIGAAVGAVSAVASYMLIGPAAAGVTFLTSGLVAGTAFASDKILAGDPTHSAIAALALQPATTAPAMTQGPSGLGSMFTQRMGAVVPQLAAGSMGAVVMEPSGVGYTAYSGGETVNLGAVNATAFGTPGFQP